jgi:predicted RNA-binding Zn ribbon-like protein
MPTDDDIHVHLHIHVDPPEPDPRIDHILEALTIQGETMTINFDTLTAEVAENSDAQASAIALIEALAEEIAAASGDQARVDALASQLSDATDALAAAVVAGTPAAPAEPPAEPTPGEPGF